MVISGFTELTGTASVIGSLVLGMFQGKELVHVGHAGTGFSDEVLAALRRRLEKLEQEKCPFHKRPITNGRVHWVRPEVLCEVEFSEWTDGGQMRHTVFVGICDPESSFLLR